MIKGEGYIWRKIKWNDRQERETIIGMQISQSGEDQTKNTWKKWEIKSIKDFTWKKEGWKAIQAHTDPEDNNGV